MTQHSYYHQIVELPWNPLYELLSRMLTTVTSLTMQQRDVLDFFTQTYRAARFGQLPCSLLLLPTAKGETLLSS